VHDVLLVLVLVETRLHVLDEIGRGDVVVFEHNQPLVALEHAVDPVDRVLREPPVRLPFDHAGLTPVYPLDDRPGLPDRVDVVVGFRAVREHVEFVDVVLPKPLQYPPRVVGPVVDEEYDPGVFHASR